MKYVVSHKFLDNMGGTGAPVFRETGESYPPNGVNVDGKWLEYLATYRTVDGLPILKANKQEKPEVPAELN